MRRACKLLYSPYRRAALRLLPSLVLIYLILLPAQVSVLKAADQVQAARDFYTWAQIFLSVAAVWPLFFYFYPIYQEQSREILTALKHPDIACAFVLWAEHQVITLPAYLIYAISFPEQYRMIGLLIIQSIFLTVLYLLIQSLSQSALIGTAILLAYITACTMTEGNSLPLILQMDCLWEELPQGYLVTRILIMLLESILIRLWGHTKSNF